MPRAFALVPALLLATAALPARAVRIDFEEFSDGETVAAPLASHDGYTLLANSLRGPDVALVHDTSPDQSPPGGLTPEGGAIRSEEDLGNVLVLADPSGGKLTFALRDHTDTLSFDWIQLGGPTGIGDVRLFLLHGGVVEAGLSEGVGSGPVHHMFLAARDPFDIFQLEFFGSIGIDNISTNGLEPVPEPASAALLGAGLAACAITRRPGRRSR